MRGPFVRKCQLHPDKDIVSSISDSGHESVWCGLGHRARSWFVVDGDGKRVAIGHINSAPQILSGEMMEDLSITNTRFTKFNTVPPPPERVCKYGHLSWVLESDWTYRCSVCRRMQYVRNKEKFRKRYVAMREKMGLPVNVRKKKKGKKKGKKNV